MQKSVLSLIIKATVRHRIKIAWICCECLTLSYGRSHIQQSTVQSRSPGTMDVVTINYEHLVQYNCLCLATDLRLISNSAVHLI